MNSLPNPEPKPALRPARTSLVQLAALFGWLGVTAFGGPAVHIALMEEEVVTRRGWMTRQDFLDFLGATNLLPGPNSTEMAIHVGRVRRGIPGLIVSGVSFILPAALIVGCLASAFVKYGGLVQIAGVLYGVKPVVIAIIAQGASRLVKTAVSTLWLGVLGMAAAIGAGVGMDALLVLVLAGVAAALRHAIRSGRGAKAIISTLSGWVPWVPKSASLGWIFLIMLKIGATIFGGGYVLVAFLRSDLVVRLHWLSEQQLLDSIAAGQVTPGPLFTTATFIGYLLGGVSGAVLATIGIFLPAFVLVAASGPLIRKLRNSPWTADVLDGVNVAALALMVVVSVQLARSAIVDWKTAAIAAASAVLLIYYRLGTTWLILAAAVLGLLFPAPH